MPRGRPKRIDAVVLTASVRRDQLERLRSLRGKYREDDGSLSTVSSMVRSALDHYMRYLVRRGGSDESS